MNNVVLLGRLTRDPELRYTESGKAVSNFDIAVNRIFSKNNEVDFFKVVAWQKTAEICNQYLEKGKQVAVLGRLQNRSYENSEGNKVYITEVVASEVEFIGGKQENKKEEPKEKPEDTSMDEFQAIDDDGDIPF